jgi:hypothetical protein
MKFKNVIKILSLLFSFVLLINCEKKDELVMQLECYGGASKIITPTDLGNYRIDAASEYGSSSAFFVITEDISNRVQNEYYVINEHLIPSPVNPDPPPVETSDPLSSIVIEYDMYLPGEEMSVLFPEGNTTLSIYKI